MWSTGRKPTWLKVRREEGVARRRGRTHFLRFQATSWTPGNGALQLYYNDLYYSEYYGGVGGRNGRWGKKKKKKKKGEGKRRKLHQYRDKKTLKFIFLGYKLFCTSGEMR